MYVSVLIQLQCVDLEVKFNRMLCILILIYIFFIYPYIIIKIDNNAVIHSMKYCHSER